MDVEVAVVGAGPAGIAAAIMTAEAGRRTVVVDAASLPGGQIWRHRSRGDLPRDARRWLVRLERCGAVILSDATVIDATTAAGAPPTLLLSRHGDAIKIEAQSVIIATGAQERFLPFPGWTTPGVFGLGGMQALVKSGALVGGLRIVLAGSGPLLLPVAALLAARGAHLSVVAEQASPGRMARFVAGLWRHPARLTQAAALRTRFLGTAYRWGTWVERVRPAAAGLSVVLTDGRTRREIACDLAGVGFGLVPATELARLLGCQIQGDRVVVDAGQRTSVPRVFAAGEPTGIAGADAALASGTAAGAAAAGVAAPRSGRRAGRDAAFAAQLAETFALREELRALPEPDTIVCRCEDVRHREFQRGTCARETKLRTRAGMGACQGRICGPMREFLFGAGVEPPRAPLFPTAVAALCSPDAGQSSTRGAP